MNPLYSKDVFDNAKSRDLLPLLCSNCHKTFLKPKNTIQKYLSNNKSHVSNDFCSKKCQFNAMITKQTVQCENCHKNFDKVLNQIKKSKHHFCSSSCSATYFNAHKTHGYRRSKMEIFAEKELTRLYPNIPIFYNETKRIDHELDIFLPSLSLAFEINGIFHYQPIYGQNKLSKTQETDKTKLQKCKDNDIELLVLNISSLKKFKEQEAQKYLNIITSTIDLKLGVTDEYRNRIPGFTGQCSSFELQSPS